MRLYLFYIILLSVWVLFESQGDIEFDREEMTVVESQPETSFRKSYDNSYYHLLNNLRNITQLDLPSDKSCCNLSYKQLGEGHKDACHVSDEVCCSCLFLRHLSQCYDDGVYITLCKLII